ncbi:MAG TPA: hypothetical protein VMQ65_03690 [Candidatus Limnocylindria bacterium]|nr:hypothetical protein [Candidatus Limnocylindria bacterium]
MRSRSPVAAALAALIALAPAVALPAFASTAAPSATPTTADAVATPPKVVIVVGAVEGSTSGYRSKGDQIYAEAIKHTPNVVKLYSPNATWAKVKEAAQDASIFIYLGHGYGFPSPYRAVLSPSVHDGMGLNEVGGISDSDKKYYGESLIAKNIKFAKNAVVILSGLCYAAGSSESGHPAPSIPVARERVDNFASGWIKAGARVVIADTWVSSVVYTIQKIFTTDQSFGQVWSGAPNYHASEQPFIPVRNPQFEARLDPESGFYRSVVGALDMSTSDVLDGAGVAPTATASPDVDGPQLWSVDGPRTITPNYDGQADKLSLLARFSEYVTWSATIRNAGGDAVRSQTGSGHQANLTWDVKIAGAAAPEGDYTWNLQAEDLAGNILEESGPFTVEDVATPPTGVLAFTPTTPTMTTGGSITYALTFAGPVTGLTVGDFTRTGKATKCVVGTPVGSGADYTIAITGCTTGTVGLYLNSGTVTGAGGTTGPVGPIIADKVTLDTTAPKATAPKPSLRTGLPLEGTSTSQRLLMSITWGGTDAGSGIASYDVARSYDGGKFKTIASATTATSRDWTMNPGHSYRFRVRARDKAGNLGAWVYAPTWYASLTQNSSSSLAYMGTWKKGSSAQYSGGTVKFAKGPGASASMTFKGRAVAWVTTLRAAGGEVQVWVDGVLAGTVDTYAASTTYRQVVFSKAWSGYGTHTIKLVVVGTPDRPRVDLDAFEIIR